MAEFKTKQSGNLWPRFLWLLLILLSLSVSCAQTGGNSSIPVPNPSREFRGVWVATVGNIDWPSKPGLPAAEQKSELIAILNRAVQLRLNVIVFQVRPACDALYASQLEPWSEYLTGTMGKDPQYDPLAFAVVEAHKRGLELHAWFNPYRARYSNARSPVAANHISRTKPQLVKQYGRFIWLDPGEREVQEHSLNVVMDVVRRYDVDGIHFDDYFYPYPENGMDFPDDSSWRKSGAAGNLSRSDWRRENVNAFVERTYNSIKTVKPWVKFGISPFGIWRPGNPPQIKGLDAYDELYADARKWLVNGWADYFVPQLYWPITQPAQSFPVLLDWWVAQNPKRRIVCAGIDVTKSSNWSPDEIPNQITITRTHAGVSGYVFWNMTTTGRDPALRAKLQNQINPQPALVPALTWNGNMPPATPTLKFSEPDSNGNVTVNWNSAGSETNRFWLVQTKSNGDWATEILPINMTSQIVSRTGTQVFALRAVSRTGLTSGVATVTFLQSDRRPDTNNQRH